MKSQENLKNNSDFLISETNSDCVNPEFEGRMVLLFADLFNPIAYMEPEIMKQNFRLLSGSYGSSIEDRSIPLPIADYLLKHASTFYMGLITNDVFRQAVVEAVNTEIILDERDDDFVKETRMEMLYPKVHSDEERGVYTIDSSRFNKGKFDWFCDRLAESFLRTEAFEDAENEMISELLDEELINNGYIISNFAYLLRAFAKNEIFVNYIMTVIDQVERKIGIG